MHILYGTFKRQILQITVSLKELNIVVVVYAVVAVGVLADDAVVVIAIFVTADRNMKTLHSLYNMHRQPVMKAAFKKASHNLVN